MMEFGKQHDEIRWVSKSKPYIRSEADVLIGISNTKLKNGKMHRSASIIFHNNQHKKFDTEYLMFGVSGTRLYMKPCDSTMGYKLSDTGASYNRYVKVPDETFADWCSNHIGGYTLCFDDNEGLYYIDAKKGE